MKNLSLLVLLLLSLLASTSGHSQKSIVADSSTLVIDGQQPPFQLLLPGDTLFLSKGIRPFIILKNIVGTAEHPIVIINMDGIVEINSNHYFGISIRQSKHIKLSGNGDTSIPYGIKIFNKLGNGLGIGEFSSDFEIEHIEVGNSQYSGIVAKTEPFCGFNRYSFIQENTCIHHCYIHDTGNEGMYIGSAFYQGQTINCNGAPTIVMPALLRNVNIHHNRVENTGWDGIQVASAINTKIHHNLIKYDSQHLVDWQMTGITLGEGSTGEIYNNKIIDGEGMGIFSKGLGDVFIYNNLVIRPGYKNNLPSGKYGIYIDGITSLPGMYFNIFNNLIIHPKFEGIRFLNAKGATKNNIINNAIFLNGYPTGNLANGYINTMSQQIFVSNNYTSTELSNARFKNSMADDYSVEEGSALIDGGASLGYFKLEFDYNDATREKGNCIDIGPIESEFQRNNSHDNTTFETVFPNPVSMANETTINFNNPEAGWVEFVLVHQNGSEIKTIDRIYFEKGRQFKTIAAGNLQPGLNYILIRKRMSNSMVKISVFIP